MKKIETKKKQAFNLQIKLLSYVHISFNSKIVDSSIKFFPEKVLKSSVSTR